MTTSRIRSFSVSSALLLATVAAGSVAHADVAGSALSHAGSFSPVVPLGSMLVMSLAAGLLGLFLHRRRPADSREETTSGPRPVAGRANS